MGKIVGSKECVLRVYFEMFVLSFEKVKEYFVRYCLIN